MLNKVLHFLILIFVIFSYLPVYGMEPDYYIIPGRQYAVLNEEILTGNNDIILRNYKIYSGIQGTIDSYGSMYYGKIDEYHDLIYLPNSFENITLAKKWVENKFAERLQLLPWTIISEKIFNQWSKEGYRQSTEYWGIAPKGLVMGDIKPIHEIVLKPFMVDGNQNPTYPEIDIELNDKKIIFMQDKPYYCETGELVLPLRPVAEKLGWTIKTSEHWSGQPLIILEKNGNKIELSVWREYFLINDKKVNLATNPRLSVNERVLVPWTFINFLTIN
ncbi:MAG: stalk domain-containing protein [Bacillota bacterium]